MITKIIAGGQIGAQRAALDWAIWHGLEHGGWCSKGRRMEDGHLDEERYKLEETDSHLHSQRTEKNVLESDGTVVFTIGHDIEHGARKAADFVEQHGKPWLHISGIGYETSAMLVEFVETRDIRVLNVAGSRESEEPGIYQFVEDCLNEAFRSG